MIQYSLNLNLAWAAALFGLSMLVILLFVNFVYARWMSELFKGDHV